MTNADHHYYLHTNGDLIYKPYRPDPSDFTKKIWSFDPAQRAHAWQIILEALALGADIVRVRMLCNKWNLTYNDSLMMLANTKPTDLMKEGMTRLITEVLRMDVDVYWERVKAQDQK